MWYELLAPLIAIEFASGDGSEERDQMPGTGKFWIYEQVLRLPYYAIYLGTLGEVEVYRLVDGRFQRVPPNERGHYPIPPLRVELGIWQGKYQNAELPWLRWWDDQGNLLLTGAERAEREHQEKERLHAQLLKLKAQLRALGVEPESSE
jgi:hypothetical protein